MTVSTDDPRRSYNGNGTTDTFATPYFLLNADIKVYVDDTLQTESTHYTLTGAGVVAGGSVVMVTPPPTGTANVVIINDPALTQGLDLVENDLNPAETREQAFDRLTIIAQRLADLIDRGVRLSDTDTASTLTLPVLADRASQFLAFDASGNLIASEGSGTPTSAFMGTVVAATTAAAARALLVAQGAHAAAARPAAAAMNAYDIWVDSDYDTDTVGVYLVVDPSDSGLDALLFAVDTSDGSLRPTSATSVVTITPGADANVTLTAAQVTNRVLVLADGSWTSGHSIIVPDEARGYVVDNTAGTYTATVTTSGGTGVDVDPGAVASVYCDATNVVEIGSAGGTTAFQLFHVQDDKSSGNDSGTFTAGAWRTRTFNTVLTNEITGASLSANQITLPAGTYWVEGSAPAYAVDRHKTRLYNVDDSSEELVGTNGFAYSTNLVETRSFVVGLVTLGAEKTLELQHRCATTKTTNGFGNKVGSAFTVTNETYSDIHIWRIA